MCFVQVERWLCPNQCGNVVRKIDGTINICEGQEVYNRTGEETALEDCAVAVNGAPDRILYNAGFAEILCVECSMNEARELYQERRQIEYMTQNRQPDGYGLGACSGLDHAHQDVIASWKNFNQDTGDDGG